MYLIRDVFHAKPGKAKELAQKFHKCGPIMKEEGFKNVRVMTDFVSTYWTVVLQLECEEIDQYLAQVRSFTSRPEVAEFMKGYMDLVSGGNREIYKIEE